jgi:hypothetical protein
MQDPELLSLRSEIALTDGRIGDLLERVSSGESGKIWADINQARKDYVNSAEDGDTEAAKRALRRLLKLAGRGHADYATWNDIGTQIRQRQTLVESERKRLVQMQQMVTAEQATVLINSIAHTIKGAVIEHCDRDTAGRLLTAIAADLARLLDRPDRGGVIASAGAGLAGRVAPEK